MRVLILTPYSKMAYSARNLYRMDQLLKSRGIETSLNESDYPSYDVVLIHDGLSDENSVLINEAAAKYPSAHIGIVGPTSNDEYIIPEAIANSDFFVVPTIFWRELMLPWRRRIYRFEEYDFEDPEGKSVKEHVNTSGLVLGYHGNEVHYAREFFPNLAQALQKLAGKHQFTLKVVTNNATAQPKIEGVDTEFIEWELDTCERQLETFDIGLCPSFSTFEDMAKPSVYMRNGNRVYTLLFWGIPSVTSPLPESCQALTHDETTLFAVSEHGWYDALERLITQPELRNRIGHSGRQLVAERFSSEAAVERFISILNQELKEPLFPKLALQPESARSAFLASTFQGSGKRKGRRHRLAEGSRLRQRRSLMASLRRRYGTTRIWTWLRASKRRIGG